MVANVVKRKKPWVTAEILDLCDRRRNLRKKRFEPEGSEKYKEVSNNIKRCMKKKKKKERKLNEEQYSEIEEKSEEEQQKNGIPTSERLDHCATKERYNCPRSFKKMPHRRTRDTELMDRIML